MKRTISHWQLPPGVSTGTWDYAHKQSIADDYDDYFDQHPLFSLDQSLVEKIVEHGEGRTIVDLGCGTGRALLPLVSKGFHGIAVDLSQSMLECVRRKAAEQNLPVLCIRANLVELDGLVDGCADYGICLFSTLGMIQGRNHRVAALRQARRVIRPGGKLILHVHNVWSAFLDPGGLRWLARTGIAAFKNSEAEFGDRTYVYRGLPNMFLHNYRLGELRLDLKASEFKIESLIPLNRTASAPIAGRRWFASLRAGGYIAVCH